MMLSDLFSSTWLTIYMVFLSGLISIFFGLWLGVILFLVKNSDNWGAILFNKTLGFLVNATRSIPYIIFMILLIPITTLIVGTSIGTNASIVPLTFASIPFFARIAEGAIDKVHYGLIEAAQSMGASKWQIVMNVLLPEAKPQLVVGATLTIILLVGYSAMAGTIGGGGLGALAIQFGYERFNLVVMLETVIVLIIIVQIIQSFGDYLVKSKSLLSLWIVLAVLGLASCGQIISTIIPSNQKILTIGIMSGPQQDIMSVAQKIAENKYNLNIKLVPFSDYNIPDEALNSGQIDANIFQHLPFLESQIKNRGYKLTPIAKTFVYPMGLYSIKYKNLHNIPYGSKIAIPNDPSNEGRALLLLQKAGLIKIKLGVSWKATLQNITSNPQKLIFVPMAAAQIPRVLDQVAIGAITNDYVNLAHLNLSDALFKENKDSPYANIIVVRTDDKNNPEFQTLIKVMHSPEMIKITDKYYPNGAAIPAWKDSTATKK